jgi:hypothetical protein
MILMYDTFHCDQAKATKNVTKSEYTAPLLVVDTIHQHAFPEFGMQCCQMLPFTTRCKYLRNHASWVT